MVSTHFFTTCQNSVFTSGGSLEDTYRLLVPLVVAVTHLLSPSLLGDGRSSCCLLPRPLTLCRPCSPSPLVAVSDLEGLEGPTSLRPDLGGVGVLESLDRFGAD